MTPGPRLSDLLTEHPFADGEGLLYGPDTFLTAGQARTAASALAHELTGAGVQPGQPVAVQLPNGPDVVTAMMGIWLAGGVFVPLNPRSPEAEAATVIDATRPAVVIRTTGLEPRPAPMTHGDDIAFVIWTSGTTGRPKAILHTHHAYLELLDRVLTPLRQGTGPRSTPPVPNLIPVSLALNAGIYNVLFGLRAGAAVVIMDGFSTSVFADLVHRFQIRSTVLPPPALVMLNDDPGIVDLRPLKYVRSITAPLSPVQARRFADRFGVSILNSYGQAEMGEVIGWTAADAKEHPEKLGAAGRPHRGVSVKIVGDGSGSLGVAEPLGVDEVGRLLVRPPSVTAGYASGEDFGDRVDSEGFVDTGDLGRIDEDGFVWIEGRAGDVINRGGNKVFPDQVEEILRLSPAVTDAAVVGVPDPRLGEVPVAFVVGDAPDVAALQALCRSHLSPYKVPVAFYAIDVIPRNEAGKILRTGLVGVASRDGG